jgi:integrase
MEVAMPARKALVPKYCLHTPSGRAYVRICGKVVYVGVYGTAESKAEYGRLVAEHAVQPSTAVPIGPSPADLTVVELCAAYLNFAEGYYRKNGRPTSQVSVIRLAIRPLKELYGGTPAAKFGPLALRAIQEAMIAQGLSRKTINHFFSTIKRLFRWAVSQELVPVAVHQSLATVPGVAKGRTAARETAPVLPVEGELVDATMPYLPPVVADMVRFQRLTGCRPGEVCQLRLCDVDRSAEVWVYRPASHKTEHHGRQRIVYVGPQAQQVLAPYLLRDPPANCFSPADSEQKRHIEQRKRRRTGVQPSQQNRRKAKPARSPCTAYTSNSYQRAIARAIVKANKERTEAAADMGVKPVLLPHWHANQLRHSTATEIRRQFGLEAAQVFLGHAKADVTQVYAERDARLGVEVAKQVG